jgi:hypothetical protein
MSQHSTPLQIEDGLQASVNSHQTCDLAKGQKHPFDERLGVADRIVPDRQAFMAPAEDDLESENETRFTGG